MSLDTVTKRIRARAADLLSRGEVDLVIGYARGGLPMTAKPFFARCPDDAELLWWDDFCVMNLAKFIPSRPHGPVAVLAKGCDARSLVVCHLENRIDLDSIKVLGIPCKGMIDAAKIRSLVGIVRVIQDVRVINGNAIRVSGEGFEAILDREESLRDVCRVCRHPNPVGFEMLCEEEQPKSPDREQDTWLSEMRSKAPAERQAFFKALFQDCIACFACRQACPVCYCETCFADRMKPRWLLPGEDGRIDTIDLHMTRAFHLAGRCTDCGACESACPMNIPVRMLTRMLNWNVERNHGYEAGVGVQVPDKLHPFNPGIHERTR